MGATALSLVSRCNNRGGHGFLKNGASKGVNESEAEGKPRLAGHQADIQKSVKRISWNMDDDDSHRRSLVSETFYSHMH